MSEFLCPYCGIYTEISNDNYKEEFMSFGDNELFFENSKVNKIFYKSYHCSNIKCKKYTVRYCFKRFIGTDYSRPRNPRPKYETVYEKQIIPDFDGIDLPDYIPSYLKNDYKEAYLIKDLSPKASATLSRRCLQSMIKDHWKITKNTLHQQVQAIENKVSASSWRAIDAVRHIGNIGAHMNREKGTDEILDVEPQEAEELLKLIELLFKDWYIAGHERAEIESKTIEFATKKGWKEKKDNENKN